VKEVFLKDLKSWENIRRNRLLNSLKDSAEELLLKVHKRCRRLASKWMSSVEEHFIISWMA
jgi:hypothetical protein